MKDPKYIIGIDLGTTHCVMAYASAGTPEGEQTSIQVFPVSQLVNPGEVKKQELLPSFLLLPGPHEVAPGGLALPWDAEMDLAVGEFARRRGAELPNRLVSSAKSWLCHAGVNRTAPILPWESQPDGRRISPVEASALYLKHLRDAWNFEMAGDQERKPFRGPGSLSDRSRIL